MKTGDSLEQYYSNFSRISLHGELGNEPAQLVAPGDAAKILGCTTGMVTLLLLATSFVEIPKLKGNDTTKKTTEMSLKTTN